MNLFHPKADERSFAEPYTRYFYVQRYLAFLRVIQQNRSIPLSDIALCEVGCGGGQLLVDFVNWGVLPEKIHAIDNDQQRLDEARKKLPVSHIMHGTATKLPWPDEAFDIVMQATLFTSILDIKEREKVAKEMCRVIKPDGIILWYDFIYNNPWNKKVSGIDKKEIMHLFPSKVVKFEKTTLLPQLGRIIVPFSWTLAWWLEKIPLLCTHYVGTITPFRAA